MSKNESFESAISKLENIVFRLEKGEESLDDSLNLFKEGTELVAFCSTVLKNAEQKITELSSLSLRRKVSEFANE